MIGRDSSHPGRALVRVVTVCLPTLGLAGSARASGSEGVTIEFFRSSFLPQAVQVSVGEAVTWVWRRGEHTVTSGTGPEDPDAGRLFDALIDEAHPSFCFPIEEPYPTGIPFFDRRLPPEDGGQLGFIAVDSGEIEHRVGVVDNVFLPDEVFIFTGDTVRWEHEPMEMFHTVTNGTGAADPEAGLLFDAPSSDDFPVFEYVFRDPGVEPYFCRPHEDLGMTGVVFVQELFIRGDATADHVLDISDAVATLSFLFLGGERRSCADALDSNDDGTIDIGDPIFALGHLFLGQGEMPPPFPRLGADRTSDALLCLP